MNGQLIAIAVPTLLVLVLGTIVVGILVHAMRQRMVAENSAALAALCSLNQSYQLRLKYSGPIVYDWVDWVNSKAKFDRYDLHNFFLQNLAALEAQILNQIAVQMKDKSVYAEYQTAYHQLRKAQLGRSKHPRISRPAFERIEQKLFTKRMLTAPVCAAQVRCFVRYSSPKGQNSYSRGLVWNLEGLRSGLAEVKQIQTARGDAVFLRQQERNKVNAGLRYRVLKRDNHRCVACGATPEKDGVTLHVDHIIPVAKGGKTVLENLQTLCAPCNLGKGYRH